VKGKKKASEYWKRKENLIVKVFIGVFSLLLGSVPIGLGYYVNNININGDVGQKDLLTISVIFFLAWFLLGMLLGGVKVDIKISLLLTHFVGIISYLSSVIQEDIIGRYVTGPFGFIPQLYFIPMLKVSYNLDFLNVIHRIPTTFFVTLVLMMSVYVAGWQLRIRVVSWKYY